jgi:Ca2+-binding RTX toxin-like protein
VGGSAADTIHGGRGEDLQYGRAGDDTILMRGTFADFVSCGAGNDTVDADALDSVEADCEDVAFAGAVASTANRRRGD